MSDDAAFEKLMKRLCRGDADAAERVFNEFSHRLVALARTRLGGKFRAKFDPEDIMQSVFKSFFQRQADDPFEFESWDSLWSLLTVLTLRKCGFRSNFFLAQRRDVTRETVPRSAADDSDLAWEAAAPDPTPLENLLLDEAVGELLRGLSARDRAIVENSLKGGSVAEVSTEIGYTQRTVQRVLARTKAKLIRLANDEPHST